MKKLNCLILIIISSLILGSCTSKKNLESYNTLKYETNEFEYGKVIHLKDIFSNNYDFNNEVLDTSKIGDNNTIISYLKDDVLYKENFSYIIKDTTPPLVYLSSSYSVNVNSEDNLLEKIICADNYDQKPNCYIEGKYNLKKAGSYKLKYIAVDSFDNKTVKEFTLNVKKPSSGSESSTSPDNINFNDVITTFKTDENMIGIDVSKWQSDIDWKKVKDAGCEFAMIRIGYQTGYGEGNEFDPKFKQNIEGALENNIKVGLYFYSYAKSEEEGISQANWIIENIQEYNIEMPIAFDWENFAKWNSLGMSLFDLRSASNAFQDTLKAKGYTPVQYGSKNYLNSFWEKSKYQTWLAHYFYTLGTTSDYKDSYIMWQLTNLGRIDGINGDVDIDIYYKN